MAPQRCGFASDVPSILDLLQRRCAVGQALLLLLLLPGCLAESSDRGKATTLAAPEASCRKSSAGHLEPFVPLSVAAPPPGSDRAEAVELIQTRADLQRSEVAVAGHAERHGGVATQSVGTGAAAAAAASAVAVGKLGGPAYSDIADGSWLPPSKPETVVDVALWLLFPLPIMLSIIGIWWFAGRNGLLKTMPKCISVLLLLFICSNQYLASFMGKVHLSLGGAVVTVVVVMDVGTLEAFCLKASLKLVGTLCGATLGAALAHVTGSQGNHPTLVIGTTFLFFAVTKAVSTSKPSHVHFITITSVTFAMIFFTPSAAVGKFVSILLGNVFAFLATFGFTMCVADPYDPEVSSLAGLVCNGGRIVGAALHSTDLAFMELQIASARDVEDILEACKPAARGLGQDFLPSVCDALKEHDLLADTLDMIRARAKEVRKGFEGELHEMHRKNEHFQSDVELLRWFWFIGSDTLPPMSEIVKAADKVFHRANGIAHALELLMSLRWQILDSEDVKQVDQVRKLLQPVNEGFQEVFEVKLWLPRTRWKALLVLMAPGLMQSSVGKHRPINQGAALEAMTKVSMTLAEVDRKLSLIWKNGLGPQEAGASERHVNSLEAGMHLLYHGMHLLIFDLCMLAKAVLSLHEADSSELVDAVKRRSEVRAEEFRQANRRLANVTEKLGHRGTLTLQSEDPATEDPAAQGAASEARAAEAADGGPAGGRLLHAAGA